MGDPANTANWSLSYDAVLLYADIMRKNNIDGNTPADEARELIKDAFVGLETFEGIQKYEFQESGDAYIPGRVLSINPETKMWIFAD